MPVFPSELLYDRRMVVEGCLRRNSVVITVIQDYVKSVCSELSRLIERHLIGSGIMLNFRFAFSVVDPPGKRAISQKRNPIGGCRNTIHLISK